MTLKDEKKYKNKMIKFIYDRHRAQVLSGGVERKKLILIYKWYKCTLCNLGFDYLISGRFGSRLRLRVTPTQNKVQSSRLSQRKVPSVPDSPHTRPPCSPCMCVFTCVCVCVCQWLHAASQQWLRPLPEHLSAHCSHLHRFMSIKFHRKSQALYYLRFVPLRGYKICKYAILIYFFNQF